MIKISPIVPIYHSIWQQERYDKKIERLKKLYCACIKSENEQLALTILDKIIEKEVEILENGYLVDISV